MSKLLRLTLQKVKSDQVNKTIRNLGAKVVAKSDDIPIVNNFSQDFIYTTPVKFGSGNNIVKSNLVIDTGSSDLWVSSAINKKYKPATNKNVSVSFNYGSGGVSGKLYSDTVTLDKFVIPKQSFALITDESQLSAPINGIMGLGFASLANAKNTPTLMDNLLKQGLISKEVFGFDNNELIIGSTDAKYTSGMKYINLIKYGLDGPNSADYGFWAFGYNGVTMSGTSMDDTTPNPSFAIADTGTSTLVFSTDEYNNIVSSLNVGDVTAITQDEFDNLSSLNLTLGNSSEGTANISIAPQYYTLSNGDGTYQLLVGGGAEQIGVVILGDPLFQSYYCEFDMGAHRIGVASKSS